MNILVCISNVPDTTSKINFIESEAGSGDGQAVLDGLSSFKAKGNLIFVCWGDTFIIDSPLAFEKHLNISDDADIFVPVIFDKKPYVKYMLKENSEFIENIYHLFCSKHNYFKFIKFIRS